MSPYKEKDAIYNAISETDYVTFRVRGGLDNKSPFVWLNNVLTIADVELNADKRSNYLSLKDAKPISSSLISKTDFNYLTSVSVIAQIARTMFEESDVHNLFSDIEMALQALKYGKDHLMVVLIFLARCTKKAGAEINVDCCVHCGATSDIVNLSFEEGGFVCRRCDSSEIEHIFNPSQMKLVRYVYKSPNYSCIGSEVFKEEDKKYVLKCIREYVYDSVGVNLTSIENLVK